MLQSLAQVQGAEAIPAIAVTIAANRQRADGFQDTVCAAGVKALGEIGSPQAIPALAEEFEKTVGKTLQHEYGSQVVAAFKAIGDPAGVPALEAYAQRLQTQRDGMDNNLMGQRYLEGKIKEVRDVIATGALSQYNKNFVLTTLDREDRLIKNDFCISKVKKFLKKSFEEQPVQAQEDTK
jgi:hypothetical protein